MIIRYLEGTTVRQVYSPTTATLEGLIDLLVKKNAKSLNGWIAFPTEAGDIAIPVASLVSLQE